ncbi:MAG: tRNA-dihydrouridine synthase [Proteobacteria bacterium]|nr:tRNA-dihydrouridine synthase [Pseudomonadota bacterium]
MVPGYKIRDIEIRPGLVLAPMSGVTTSAFRRLIKELNPECVGYTLSEFVSVEGMTRGSKRTIQMMRFREMERPYAVQIFGYDVQRMSDAAKMVEDFGADIVDINCGCPAPKVVKRGGGAELMRQPDHLQQIFKAVRAAVKIPLTMKMRSGWDSQSLNCVEIARMAEGEGVEALTVHGRTRAQLYRGDADWSMVQQVAQAVKIPVCGSGDVQSRADAQHRFALPGVAGIYIGRGAMSNPYVFSEICGVAAPQLRADGRAVIKIARRYIELLSEDLSPQATIGKVKQLISQMGRGHGWRRPLLRAMQLKEQIELLSRIEEGLESGASMVSLGLDACLDGDAIPSESQALLSCEDGCSVEG